VISMARASLGAEQGPCRIAFDYLGSRTYFVSPFRPARIPPLAGSAFARASISQTITRATSAPPAPDGRALTTSVPALVS